MKVEHIFFQCLCLEDNNKNKNRQTDREKKQELNK